MTKLSKKDGTSNLKLTVYWGDILYDTSLCQPNKSITVGPSIGNTFVFSANSISEESFELVKMPTPQSAVLRFNDHLDGHISIGKEFLSLASAKKSKFVKEIAPGVYEIAIERDDKADIVIGHLSFYIDWINTTQVIPRTEFKWKWGLLLFLLISFCAGIVIFLANFVTEDVEPPPERLVTILPKLSAKAAMGEKVTNDGGAQKGESGKVSYTPPTKVSAADSLRKANLGSVLSGLKALGNTAPDRIDPNATKQSALNQKSTGGFSTTGLKTGAGGKTVGIGRTLGQGEGGFEGTGRLGLSGDSVVEGSSGSQGSTSTVSGGGLDRDVIESVIRRRQDRIRLCYERQLNFHPKLSGKMTVHFVIGKIGNVLSASVTEDTMKDSTVKACVLAEVRTWTFPIPEGGTLVNVDYPFVFESSAK